MFGTGTSTGKTHLIWLDRNNYIRFERAAVFRQHNVFCYVNFEQRANGKMAASVGTGTPDGLVALRLELRGPRVSAAYRGGRRLGEPPELDQGSSVG